MRRVRDLWAPSIVLIALIGREGHGLAGTQQVSRTESSMPDHTFSHFVYCDTNILSELAKQPTLWPPVREYLLSRDLTIAVSSQVAELSDAEGLHEGLNALLVSVPSAVIKQWDVVLGEEVKAHPDERSESLLAYPLNAVLFEQNGFARIREFLGSPALRAARSGQREASAKLMERHSALKGNFPPGPTGKYTKEQAPFFASVITMQWLADEHREFLEQFRNRVEAFRDPVFRSVRLYALVLFYKYYLGGRNPKRPSDFGDLFHLYALPYCAIAVVERDLANVLTQIKRADPVLKTTDVRDIDFLRAFASGSDRKAD